MSKSKRTYKEKAKAAGATVTMVSDFLGLSPAEEALIEIRLALRESVKQRRKQKRLSQGR